MNGRLRWTECRLGWAIAALTLGGGTLYAQQTGPADSGLGFVRPVGIHFYSASAYTSYYTSGLAYVAGLQAASTNQPGDIGIGASATFGWSKPTGKFHWTADYSLSYSTYYHYSEFSSLNHSFSIAGSRQLGQKWSFGVYAGGTVGNVTSYMSAPTALDRLTALPVTFEDLSAAVLKGVYSNGDLASILTNAPLTQSGTQALFYGNRVLSSTLSTSLSYARSSRLTINFGAGGGRTQHLSENKVAEAPGNGYLTPATTTASASVSLSYSLSARTQAGVEAGTSRNLSRYDDSYRTSVSGSLGRTLSTRWFARAQVGIGLIETQRQTFAASSPPQVVGSVSIGYKAYAHSLIAAYNRTIADAYGFGATTSSSVSASWGWSRPGRSWSTNVGITQQQLQGAALHKVSGWGLLAGFSRRLTSNTSLGLSYSYLRYSGQLVAYPTQEVAVSAASASFSWSPRWGIL